MAWWITVSSTNEDTGDPVESTYQVDASREAVEALASEINGTDNGFEARAYGSPQLFSVEEFRTWEEVALLPREAV